MTTKIEKSDRDLLIEKLEKSEIEITAFDDEKVIYNGFTIIKQIQPAYVKSTRYIAALPIASTSTSPTTGSDRHLAFYMGKKGKLKIHSGDNIYSVKKLFKLIDKFLSSNLELDVSEWQRERLFRKFKVSKKHKKKLKKQTA